MNRPHCQCRTCRNVRRIDLIAVWGSVMLVVMGIATVLVVWLNVINAAYGRGS